MSTRGQKIEVVKIPRDTEPTSRVQSFPRMPIMYLELIENKAKIKPHLMNKDYVHAYGNNPTVSSPSSSVASDRSPPAVVKNDDDSDDEIQKEEEPRLNRLLIEDESDDEPVVAEPEDDRSVASNDLSKRLTDMLGDSDDEDEPKVAKKKDKYSKHRDDKGHSISKNMDAPSFAELAAAGSYVPRKELRDINDVTGSEKQDEDSKRELLFKFEILRKSYPTATIPVYSVHTEYKTMLNAYDDSVRRLSLDSSVDSYKTYLIYAFMAVEFLFGKVLKLDMDGFTQQQIVSMSSYEKLLIELGEKSYIPEGSAWSVEVRLFALVLLNSAVFIASKMFLAKTSGNLMDMLRGVTENNKPKGGDDNSPKRKMKGPDINIDDL
jgi:hypothetical protein